MYVHVFKSENDEAEGISSLRLGWDGLCKLISTNFVW